MIDYPLSSWRLLQTSPARGAWNMAVDEAVLEAIGRKESLPTLRLYAWKPPCLSLGYSQPFTDVDQISLSARDWDLVRRPTGGRAILHTDELTYSVMGPAEDPRLTGNVLESYRKLAEALLVALRLLGLPAESLPEAASVPGRAQSGPVCFEVPSNYEITVDGKKLIGSAQARRKEGVLQHGSLPLFGDLRRITHALSFPDEKSREQSGERLLAKATTIETALGSRCSWEQAAQAFASGFRQTLNLELLPGSLTPAEQDRAARLVEEKYANPAWTERV